MFTRTLVTRGFTLFLKYLPSRFGLLYVLFLETFYLATLICKPLLLYQRPIAMVGRCGDWKHLIVSWLNLSLSLWGWCCISGLSTSQLFIQWHSFLISPLGCTGRLEWAGLGEWPPLARIRLRAIRPPPPRVGFCYGEDSRIFHTDDSSPIFCHRQ